MEMPHLLGGDSPFPPRQLYRKSVGVPVAPFLHRPQATGGIYLGSSRGGGPTTDICVEIHKYFNMEDVLPILLLQSYCIVKSKCQIKFKTRELQLFL